MSRSPKAETLVACVCSDIASTMDVMCATWADGSECQSTSCERVKAARVPADVWPLSPNDWFERGFNHVRCNVAGDSVESSSLQGMVSGDSRAEKGYGHRGYETPGGAERIDQSCEMVESTRVTGERTLARLLVESDGNANCRGHDPGTRRHAHVVGIGSRICLTRQGV
jgi:hypothetical protein